MSLPTYESIAARYGIDLCQDQCARGNHRLGWADPIGIEIHWAAREPTKVGIRRFLMLVSEIIVPKVQDSPRWLWLYLVQKMTEKLALEDLHMRFPREFSAEDRSKIRWLMAGEKNKNHPWFKKAARWAAER